MDRDSLRAFRTFALAACVAAAALCTSAFAAPKALAGDFFEAYEAFQRGDYDEARAIWSTFAYAGDVDAQFNLGTLYENGLGVEADAEKAARWYRAAASRRVDLARLALARLQRAGALEPEPDEDQIKLLEIAARRGLAEAQYELGVAYDHGLGVTQNHATAAGWYHRAAEQGLTTPSTIWRLSTTKGWAHRAISSRRGNGTCAPPTPERRRAMNNLGYIYEKGLTGVRDYGKAVVWYRRAARKGLAIAQSNLAALHYLGRGVTRDFEQAYHWYKAAAEQGDAVGRNGLGLLYANGLGVERDLVQAMAWFNLAAHAKGPAGDDAISYRDRLTRLMSPEERAEAEALSAELLVQADAKDAPEEPTFGVALPRPANGFRDSAIYAQRLLKSLGYYDAAVDGVAGELTIKATRHFLKENGLRMEPQITRDLVKALEEVGRPASLPRPRPLPLPPRKPRGRRVLKNRPTKRPNITGRANHEANAHVGSRGSGGAGCVDRLVLALLVGCATGDDQAYVERSVEELYNEAMDSLLDDDFEAAAAASPRSSAAPYSVWATRAQIMSAFVYYQGNRYDEAHRRSRTFRRAAPGPSRCRLRLLLDRHVLLRTNHGRGPRSEDDGAVRCRLWRRWRAGSPAALTRAMPASRSIWHAIIWPARR